MERRNSQQQHTDDEYDDEYDRSLPSIRDYFGAYLQGNAQAPPPDPRRAQLDPRAYAAAAPQHAVPPNRAPYGVHPGVQQPHIQRSATPHAHGYGYHPGQQSARPGGPTYAPPQAQGARPPVRPQPHGGAYPTTPSGPAGGEYIILRPQVRSGSLQVAAASNQSFDAALAAYRQHEAQRAREQPSLEDLSDHDSDDGRTPEQCLLALFRDATRGTHLRATSGGT
ncbi:hypothetical protein AURDEDRAFT_127169 [Auricularia subglabra TFB-10046 SS5]|nr:hypothetical protein AURDEDRAFT_127169 [Auricularia subglabra TFB-10046 SS5]